MDEKLAAVINKAFERGWKPYDGIDPSHLDAQVKGKRIIIYYYNDSDIEVALSEYSVYGVIFDHGFAKAIWGEEQMDDGGWQHPVWEWRLADMVVHPDPVEYLITLAK